MCSGLKRRDQRDVIPITTEEGALLRTVVNVGNKDTMFYTPVVMRSVLENLVNLLPEDSPLTHRIKNTNVHWEPVRSVETHDPETVYDFDVPDTKLYVVNDGIVTYDTVSINGIISEEATEEVKKYLNSKERYLHANGSLMPKMTDLIALTIFNLSRDPVS